MGMVSTASGWSVSTRVCPSPYPWGLLEPAAGSVGSVQRVSPMPYSPRLSCEQVEANLAWVAESATVGPALWAEARATGLLGEEVPLPRY